ncbi:MAG TPA: helix-turn-helix domain-containing protein [Candidatus Acidoferrum sp.]|nr:helix-turn-helix domain-containing protein [Candidatus Acidoferrum sp.]
MSDADRVRDEPNEPAIRDCTTDAPATFSVASVEHASAHDDAWSGLEVDQTLGQLMTEFRKHSGLSREQVAEQTHIPAYYVRMIESDTYDAIPDQLYLLPFFERYAIFLGLDAQKVVSRFIRDFEKAENELSEPPAAKITTADVLLRWRKYAAPAAIAVILLPCVAWGVGTIRTVLRDARSHPSAVAPRSSPALSADARPAATPQALAVPVQTSDSTTTSPAPAGSNVSSQIPPPLHAQARQRRSRSHQIARHRKHSRRA